MTADMEKLMHDYMAAGDSHDVKKTLSYYTDDCVWDNPAEGVVKKGKKELSDILDGTFKQFPDLKIESRSYFFTADRICWEWVMSGTHSGDLPNLPATGKTMSARGATILEFKGEKISRETIYYDSATILRQLGALPAPAGAAT